VTEFFVSHGMTYDWAWFLATIIGILAIALPLMLAVAMIIYADRKIWAAIALRRGPNVVGPFGLLQSFADGLKVFLQETIIPSGANRGLFLIAPIITFTVALMAWAVIPFQAGVVLADINVGLLYILAISSLGVYGVVISGWASNSKYPFFSALRAAAQMISYEVSIGFILISIVLYAGSFNLSVITLAQKGNILGIFSANGLNPLLFPIAVMFLISSMAETARAPFDLTEAESELVAGYQTEYSSMSFALFWLGEYANVILMCALNAILFWGGWLPPVDWAPLYAIPGIIWLFAKILVFFFIFSWVKATVPRYRYDQLMRLGWKVFLPISLFWVCLVSGWLMLTRYDGDVETVYDKPTIEVLAVLGASDVCQLREGKHYGADEFKSKNVYLYRPVAPMSDGYRIEIKYPKNLAGNLRFKSLEYNGFGGSGALEWVGQQHTAKLALGFTDVIYDKRPGAILFFENGDEALMGDCLTRSQLKA
jgi:NADH-quinone oxidoreductase subunit H